MTKTELIKTIQEIYNDLDDLQDHLGYVSDIRKKIQRKIENIPEDPKEIEEDEKEED